MNIETIIFGKLAVNCYLLSDENSAIVIDPAENNDRVEQFLLDSNDKQRLILLTHCHFDHIGAAEYLRNKTGVKIAIGENDASSLLDPEITLSSRFHAHIAPFNADILLKDGEVFNVGSIEFKAIETKGHTAGGMCYQVGDALFSGDTLFNCSVGRVDFPGGNKSELLNSLKKLDEMFSDDIFVYPGHGQATTLSLERIQNPFMKPDGEYLL